MTGHSSKGLRAAVFLSIAMVILAVACGHRSSAPEDATRASSEALHKLVGKHVTVRGKFSLGGKFGPYVVLANQHVVYLVPRGSFTWGEPYSRMEGKLVAATGVLAFSHSPDAESADAASARAPDYFYFEAETTQVQRIGNSQP